MLSLGGERLTTPSPPPTPPPPKKMFWIITCTTIWLCNHYYGVFCSFTHLRILRSSPKFNQFFMVLPRTPPPPPPHKLSLQSVHNVLSNVVHRQTNHQTDTQTNQRYQKHNLLCQGGQGGHETRMACLETNLVLPCQMLAFQVLPHLLSLLNSTFR